MKKKIFLFALMLGVGVALQASILVYKDKEAILQGQPWIGTLSTDGVVITSQQAMDSQMKPLIGTKEEQLFTSKLIRLDTEINMALVRPEEKIEDAALLTAHQANLIKMKAFLPAGDAVVVPSKDQMDSFVYKGVTEAFQIKVNDQVLEGDPLVLPVKYRKSNFKLELVNLSTAAVWQVEVKLKADPKLSFWKKGRKKGLNDVPRPTFRYYHQSMFKPLRQGDSFTIPVEIFYIKKDAYQFRFRIKSKAGEYVKSIPVQFKKS